MVNWKGAWIRLKKWAQWLLADGLTGNLLNAFFYLREILFLIHFGLIVLNILIKLVFYNMYAIQFNYLNQHISIFIRGIHIVVENECICMMLIHLRFQTLWDINLCKKLTWHYISEMNALEGCVWSA